MSRARLAAVAIAAVTLWTGRPDAPEARQAQTGQTFRAATDVVTVDVSVRSDGVPIAGLTPADFVLLDNGVRQQVEIVAVEAVPIDVTLVVDTGEDVADDIEDMSANVHRILDLVRPTDQVRVMTAGPYVRELIPARPAADLLLPTVLSASGKTSAFDALAAALLRRVDLDRRHLVIALMNGIDAMSTLEAADVRDIAERSSATLHIAQVDLVSDFGGGWIGGRERLTGYQCRVSKVCEPKRHFWAPYDEHRFETLDDAARATGGRFHFPGFIFIETAAEAFQRAFEDYRRSYLLRYTPTNVERDGWHDVEVSVPAHPDYTVRARRGYSVEPLAAGPAGGVPEVTGDSGAPVVPSSAPIDLAAGAYDRGDYASAYAFVRRSPDLAASIRDFESHGNRWPASPRREAAFVIELAQAGFQRGAGPAAFAARDLLRRHAALVRHPIEPDGFERDWHWARLALATNTGNPDLAGEVLDAALARFPDEPRFVLARAVVLDQRRPPDIEAESAGERMSAATASYVEDVLEHYASAMRFDGTAPEAAVRAAWLLHRVARFEDALTRLDEAPDVSGDSGLAYLRELVRARTLDALGRLEEAAVAFRAALEHAPTAQSAQVGLMNIALRRGNRAEAERLAELVHTLPEDAVDPWWAYWSGDYRHFGEVIGRLREQAR